MAYAKGFMNKRIGILNRAEVRIEHGAKKGGDFELSQTVWANVQHTKGAKPLQQGALEAYEVVMVRTAWHETLQRSSRLLINGTIYQIENYTEDRQADEMQIICSEIVNS